MEYFRFLNVDAGCREECGFVGVGVAVRDSQGVVIACLARKLVGSFPPIDGIIFSTSRRLLFPMISLQMIWSLFFYDIRPLLRKVAGGSPYRHVPRNGQFYIS
ncbi:hypothetical protein TIFTF001_033267 [Ficus carica]|uniref:RNase H type-1 domain-containing protein n=1 Tax=Ficus carica TaxID=3494 RepID=A0AA88J8Y8_FICCA|nr:hypothetical protein TIFTF001_033267 [Ficus carica]